jgi:hypothetical protein
MAVMRKSPPSSRSSSLDLCAGRTSSDPPAPPSTTPFRIEFFPVIQHQELIPCPRSTSSAGSTCSR